MIVEGEITKMFLYWGMVSPPYEDDSRRGANVHSINNQDYSTYLVKYVDLKVIRTSED